MGARAQKVTDQTIQACHAAGRGVKASCARGKDRKELHAVGIFHFGCA